MGPPSPRTRAGPEGDRNPAPQQPASALTRTAGRLSGSALGKLKICDDDRLTLDDIVAQSSHDLVDRLSRLGAQILQITEQSPEGSLIGCKLQAVDSESSSPFRGRPRR